MPRPLRLIAPQSIHHVVNRGNDRKPIFLDRADYDMFLRFLRLGTHRYPVTVHHYCVMPNHFHAMLRADTTAALSAYMQWVTGNYATQWRIQTGTRGNGHVFQRRFWNHPITDERHYVTVARYIEANAARAGLVIRAEDWRWSSIAETVYGRPHERVLSPPLVTLPAHWRSLVNSAQSDETIDTIRRALRRYRATRPVAQL